MELMPGLTKFTKLFLIILSLQISIQKALSQSPEKLRSALCISGSSGTVAVQSKQYFVQQIVGQSGIVGLAGAGRYQLRQGSLQLPAGSKQVLEPELLKVTVSPNPFPGEVRIAFMEKISDRLFVSVCDLSGKAVFFNTYPASQEINLDLGSLRPSLYIIKVYTDKKYYISKLIRE